MLLEAPTCLATIQALDVYGAELQGGLPLSAEGIDPDALRRAIAHNRPAFVYLIPTFQNPSACCYTGEVRRAVAGALDETGVPLIQDDPYRDLVYQPADRTPICAYLRRAPCVYLGSFSKITAPGLRVGYLAASPTLFRGLVRLKQASDLHTNRLGQVWLARFLNSDEFEAHRARMIGIYRERRDAMQTALLHHFAELAEWQVPAGGLFFWLRLSADCDTLAALQAALARDVAFMPGEPFFPLWSLPYPAVRLNFSHAAPEPIEQGIAVLGELLSGLAEGVPSRHSRAAVSV